MINSIPLESINENDLQKLIDNKISEMKIIEYKQELPERTHAATRDFLAHVCSFANASGGDLLFGIKAKEGIPVEICGLDGSDFDAEKLRLEGQIRDCIKPRIVPSVGIHLTKTKNSKPVMILRIPKSWNLPHVVDYEKHWRFYSRNSAGRYPLDVSELRTAFTYSQSNLDRVQDFRNGRLAKIVSDEAPILLRDFAKIVLHVVPFNAFDPSQNFELSKIAKHPEAVKPMFLSGWNNRYNFDGFLTYYGNDGYVQVFRNGIVESVNANYLSIMNNKKINILRVEQELLQRLDNYLTIQREIGVLPPVFVMLTLLNIKDYIIELDNQGFGSGDIHPVDRTNLIVPAEVIDDLANDWDETKIMKPIFDAIGNASGFSRSMHYDKTGKWLGTFDYRNPF